MKVKYLSEKKCKFSAVYYHIIIQKDHDDISKLDVLIAESDVNYNDLASIETVEI